MVYFHIQIFYSTVLCLSYLTVKISLVQKRRSDSSKSIPTWPQKSRTQSGNKLNLSFLRLHNRNLSKHIYLRYQMSSETKLWSQIRNYQANYSHACGIQAGSVWCASVTSCYIECSSSVYVSEYGYRVCVITTAL
jgi:hypothetical protein